MGTTRDTNRNFDAIIFDFRGVLYRKTEKDRRAFFVYLQEELGLPKKALKERMCGIEGKLKPEVVAEVLEASFDCPAIHQKLQCAPGLRRSIPIEENIALVPKLARQYKLGLLANSDGSVEDRLTTMGLRCYFNSVIDSEIVGFRKPDRRIYLLSTANLVVQPERCVFIDDRIENVEAAIALGMTGIHFEYDAGDDLAEMLSEVGITIPELSKDYANLARVS